MKLFGLKTCDTCRKALKSLATAGRDVTYLDVRKDGVPQEILEQAWANFGNKLVNKSSATWRGLSEDEKANVGLETLIENPTLMKRPLIVDGDRMTLGWKKEVEDEYL